MPLVIIVLSASTSLIAGICLIELFPDMTRMQAATWGVAIFALICAPSLAAVFARRPLEDDEIDTE